ncbi:hypothetical protein H1V43_33710 [Streptomyces sp. PSKA54]|uniref:Uncharacterized protein n=1 Tax=Streptomyces himalayensis subsp. aureolus TaxID=2758039 RepID=A0A7W2D7H2_9ACTN|nr:hypothetical protein [Streptomyces himalayensis]MBA4866194.1 hypothetical protein [Streptomyces himalayensis subsp. aureolus]
MSAITLGIRLGGTPLYTSDPRKEASRSRMTCADTTMSASLIHDVSAQYVASVMFALTVLAAGTLRAAWRRRSRRQGQETTTVPETAESVAPEHDLCVMEPTQESKTSSEGRREVSS